VSEDTAALKELSISMARLEGKVDAYQAVAKLEMLQFQNDIALVKVDQIGLHRQVDSLKSWRTWIVGVGSGLGLAAGFLTVLLYTHNITIGVHP
jgi:hypothetical protein